jgi:hypothetical protein
MFATSIEESTARKSLDALNQPTSVSDGTSHRLEKALSDLQQLLQPDNLTQ